MDDDDAQLVALIDGELDEESRRSLRARLDEDERLRSRYQQLREGPASIAAAFDSMLAQAPVERLKAALPKESPAPNRPWFFQGFALRALAAGFVAGLIVAGAAAWIIFALTADEDNWRTAVVDYMKLYTNDTFAMSNPPPQIQAAQLQAVGENVGAALTPEKVALPDLTFKVAFNLAYEGAPLGEIAYTEPTGAPVLVCVIADKSAAAPIRVERRDDFTLAFWARDGRGFLVIGRIPEQRAHDLARTLSERI